MGGYSDFAHHWRIFRPPAASYIAVPEWMNDANLAEVLLALELELLSPAVRRSVVRLDELLADEFVEFGSSGRIYDKHSIVSLLTESKPSENFEIDNFRLVTTGEHEVLATYQCAVRSGAGGMLRKSNRSSLWALRDGGWQMIFHQGTRAE